MDAQQLIKTLTSGGTRSGERLAILCNSVLSFPPEKLAKVKIMQVEWNSLEGELVPNLNLEFFQ